MGRGGGVAGGRPPSQAAYFVALAGVAALLAMLCCYFIYFCITKIHELSEHPSLCGSRTRIAQPAPARDSYPVQPVVRESATAMAKLCKELPARGAASPGLRAASGPGAPGGARGSRGSGAGSEAAALSDDTATTGASRDSSPPPPPPAR